MRVLVLGGTHHVGRCVVEAALAAGDDVVTINRGRTTIESANVERRLADRNDPTAYLRAIGTNEWDVVIDTWSGAPRRVHEAAQHLSSRAQRYVYVSSRSVYRWPMPSGLDESGPVVTASADDDDATDYARAKRGGELAVIRSFADRALIARPGLILGPYELVGRLPWWLRRIQRGGPVLAPGPYERALQYIDGRDLAIWILAAARNQLAGTYNTVSRPGHCTMGSLLDECRRVVNPSATLVWFTPEEIERAGVEPWTQLPIWLPPSGEAAALHDGDVSLAFNNGLTCRAVDETVRDTWEWLRHNDALQLPASVGLDAAREEELLREHASNLGT